MGCEVVSVYADEVMGVMGFPESIADDLRQRDHIQINHNFNINRIKKSIKKIHGYTHSYTMGFLETIIMKETQHLIYNAWNFLIVQNMDNGNQKLLEHKNIISSVEVFGKLCATGTTDGTITVWDMQYAQAKVIINLPQKVIITSIGITPKYLLVSDNSQPQNRIFAYDVQTSKFLGAIKSLSNQPTYKGISFGVSHLVTIGADGIWFFKANMTGTIQITKGIFGIYPKTSMTSVTKIKNQYILTGGVDGYIFAWNINYQCIAVHRIHENSCIIDILLHENMLFTSGLQGKTKCSSYQLIKFDNQRTTGTPTFELKHTVLTTYTLLSPVQSICVSKKNKQICYLQSRRGQIISKIIPQTQVNQIKRNITKGKVIQDYQSVGVYSFASSEKANTFYLWHSSFMKLKDKGHFHIVKIQINVQKNTQQIFETYQIKKKIKKKGPYALCPQFQQMAAINKQNKLMIFDCRQKMVQEAFMFEDQQRGDFFPQYQEIDTQKQFIDMYYVESESKRLFFFVEQNTRNVVFQAKKDRYIWILSEKTDKKIIKIDQQEFVLNEVIRRFQLKKDQQIEASKRQDILAVHHARVTDYFRYNSNNMLTVGNGILVHWN